MKWSEIQARIKAFIDDGLVEPDPIIRFVDYSGSDGAAEVTRVAYNSKDRSIYLEANP